MSFKKKQAFTLTELLVVVIVIGVLSAVVPGGGGIAEVQQSDRNAQDDGSGRADVGGAHGAGTALCAGQELFGGLVQAYGCIAVQQYEEFQLQRNEHGDRGAEQREVRVYVEDAFVPGRSRML